MITIGIDIGGSSIKAALTDTGTSILARTQRPTLAEGGVDETVGQLHACVEELIAAHGAIAAGDVAGIGVGVPGAIDHDRGMVLYPPNLPAWKEVPLAALLSDRWDVPVLLENDANCAALGERHYGAGRSHEHFIALTLGTGVGGGIITGGRIFRGARGFAGEFGHISIDADGPACNCGSRGCIEAYVGIHYLMREALPDLRNDPDSLLHTRALNDAEALDPKDIAEAAAEGDATCIAILRRAGERLGVAIASAANLLDIETFIIGGGIAGAGAPLFDGIAQSARQRVLKVHRESLALLPAELGNDAGMLGAASLML